MLKSLDARRVTLLIFVVALATIAGAWVFEWAGYLPCELCLKQRWAYYFTLLWAPVTYAISSNNPKFGRRNLYFLMCVWGASAIFGVYHSGVEWGWWQGPSACSGGGELLGAGDGLPDLSTPGVMCNEAAIRIIGLSLAGWNAVISTGLALLAWFAARR
jgi:disulfide bond formation protein DsbB